MSWFYLALLAPLLYAIVNLLDDNLLRYVYKSPYFATVSAGLYGSLPLLSRLFIHAPNISPGLATLSVSAGFLTLAYYFFYFKGLESDTPSIVVALFGLAPATIPFFAHFVVHERLPALAVAGFLVVLVASLGLAVADLKQLKFSKALLPVVVAVVFMDVVAIMTKYVYQQADFYPAYLYFSAGMGLSGVFFFFAKFTQNKQTFIEVKKVLKRLLPVFIAAELTGLAAEFTLNLAISRGPVSLVKVIEGIQPMFVLLIALALYPFSPKYFREAEEGKPVRKFILMAVVVSGLAIIAIATKA
ncbi:MAG TPA: EamA family transporter [Candidatus Saccharimonadales bacterium]|nr:EamA family transporter [Candidatus Saccharimonadales bacterium]